MRRPLSSGTKCSTVRPGNDDTTPRTRKIINKRGGHPKSPNTQGRKGKGEWGTHREKVRKAKAIAYANWGIVLVGNPRPKGEREKTGGNEKKEIAQSFKP